MPDSMHQDCIHDLPPGQCAFCSGRGTKPAENLRYGPWFLASYPGRCDGCDDEIVPGERIRSDGEGGWLCDGCGAAS